ncbi:MAG: hypothetical protein H7Y61_02240 [Rhizobiales bacterium]|nr:hypothetical protein [Rhizobacter sp.]
MIFRKPSSRWALWVFAAALLLKSAMPWLASASAELQGKTLVEICTVYGVSLVPLAGSVDDASHEPAPAHGAAHSGEHCALTALTALAAPLPSSFDMASAQARTAAPPRAHPSSQAPDACATWVARLKHGPPAFA